MFDQITPVILTFNEETNIERVLGRLAWAEKIIAVDSCSTDKTLEILSRYDKVKVFERSFDNHAAQWNYAVHETGIETEWVLALDADYVLSQELIDEIGDLKQNVKISGYMASFRYCVFGRPLRGNLYPPVTVLYCRKGTRYVQDGHTQRIDVRGTVKKLKNRILHDDRKPLSSWLQAQDRYMALEANLIHQTSWADLRFPDRMRKLIVVAPILIFFYCILVNRGLLDGKAGLYYALQRTLAEIILSLKLIKQ